MKKPTKRSVLKPMKEGETFKFPCGASVRLDCKGEVNMVTVFNGPTGTVQGELETRILFDQRAIPLIIRTLRRIQKSK